MATRITEMMLISSRKFVLENYGPSAWQRLLDGLGAESRGLFDQSLAPKRRFDFPVAVDVLSTLVKSCDAGDQDGILTRLGRHNAEHDLGSTEKLLMRALTVKMVLRIASMLWTSRVKQGGRMVIESRGKGAAAARIEQPPDVSALWWKYLAGWFQRTIELAGGKDVKSEWAEGGRRPGESVRFDVSWS